MLSFNSFSQKPFTITGRISGLKDSTKVWFLCGDVLPGQETMVLNGKFTFKGNISEPAYASIFTRPSWAYDNGMLIKDYQNFFLESGQTTIIGTTIAEAEITGGPTQTEFNQSGLNIVSEWGYDVALPYMWGYYNDKALFSKLEPIKEIRTKKVNDVKIAYIKSHPDSYVSLYWLGTMASKQGFDPYNPLFKVISLRMQNSRDGKELTRILKSAKDLAVGKYAIDFKQADTAGKIVTLNDFKGKYVLIDFWASWCAPCRAESPNLVKAYKNYKSRNFDIISISLDAKKNEWMNAIHKDNYTWTNLSDLKFRQNAIALAWGVTSVPRNYLLDPNGKIIAMDLRGEELAAKLKEIIK